MFRKQIEKYTLFVYFVLVQVIAIGAPIKGVVFDSKTNEPLPYVNILIKGTTNGTITNSNGEFELDEELAGDAVLIISFIGYKNLELKFDSIANRKLVTIFMEEEEIALGEVEVSPDNSYAQTILRNIIKNRKRNNPDNFRNIDYNEYMRKSIFLLNLNRKIVEMKAFRSNADAFIVQSDSTVSMPIYFSEQHISHTRNRDEDIDDEEVLSTESECTMPQLQNTINTVVTKKITAHINFYNNQINVIARGFPSPIGANSHIFYNSYLVDSLEQNGVMQYRFDFYPKSYRSAAFKGYFWVDSETFALTEIHAKILATANVNFVDDFESHIYYQPISNKRWFYKKQKIKVNLVVSKSKKDKSKKKNLSIQNLSDFYRIETPETIAHSKRNGLKSIQTKEQLLENYEKQPFDSLEVLAYEGIKKLKNNKTVRNISRFSDMTLNGYYNFNKIDFGSYMDVYRKNAIEGDRFTLPLRTSEKLFENFTVGGYVGYGFKDKKAKYGGVVKYKLPVKRRTILTLKYDNEYYAMTQDKFVEFIRENPYEAGGGNFASSVTTTVPNPYMIRQQKMSFSVEHQLAKDIGVTVRPFYSRYYSNQNVPFILDGKPVAHFNNYGVLTDLRFSFGQPFDEGFFYRVYYGNQKPVIHVSTVFAKYAFTNGETTKAEPYFNINVSLKNRLNFGPAFLKLMLNAGYISGDVPYPLLFTPRGTQDLGFARYHYNLLFNSSFAADLYSNLHLSFNGGGIVLGKIPLIKTLNLRETISFKSFWGKQTGNHEKVMNMPGFLQKPLNSPYMEMGFGITNIFKVLRIEYICRLNRSELYNQFSSKHGIRLRIEVSF